MTIRTATPDDLPQLRELFARANDAPYDLAAVAEEKCFGDGIAGAPVTTLVEESGRIRAAAVRCGRWLRVLVVERDARRQGLGTRLLEEGISVIAAEPGNYFTPGVALNDEGARAFFRARGFAEKAVTWNLDVELGGDHVCHPESPEPRLLAAQDDEGPPAVHAVHEERAVGRGSFDRPPPQKDAAPAAQDDRNHKAQFRRPSHDEAGRVLAFVERAFGRIWRFEAAKAFERDVPPAFIAEEGGEIVGFAVHDVNNRGLGWFGPTGVDPGMRGRGVGGRLLLASLQDLRRLGYARAVIPWTDALEFYRKAAGANPAQQFVSMGRPLERP
ncbi:MAG TPA: GNAT family N-acetyltransferase [Thermoanaerobaculia bacterium]|nr:GNAT family N-acetyltransferase [Thermoanaerobaculia bacterium]